MRQALVWCLLLVASGVQAQQNEYAKLTASDAAPADWLGHAVSISGDTALLGAPFDDDRGDASGSAYVFVNSGSVWAQQQKLVPSDVGAFDEFGYGVSVSGDTAVVGARLGVHGGQRTGTAYVFVRSGSVWSQQQKLTASDAAVFDQFGTTVSVSGNTVVVGAWNDGSGSAVGSAYVFVRSGTVWTQQQKLTATDAAPFDEFGASVAVAGDTVVIGSKGDDDGGTDSGSVYVFVRSGAIWTQQQKLTASDRAAGDFFGWSVAVSGDTAIVGAYRDDDAGSSSGSAYVFVRTGTAWSQQQKLTANDAAADDRFGYSVSLSGEIAVVGAQNGDDQGADSGAAYTFVRAGVTWTQQKLLPSDGAAGDAFGYSVAVCGAAALVGSLGGPSGAGSGYVFRVGSSADTARLLGADGRPNDGFGVRVSISGDTAVVGAPYADGTGLNSGAAYVFARANGVWVQKQRLTAFDAASTDVFGWSVAVSGSVLVVGAPLDDARGTDSGSVYVYLRDSLGVWNLLQKLTASDGQAGDRFGTSAAVTGGELLPATSIVVGAQRGDGIVGDSGSAYVFAASGFTLVQQQKLFAIDGAANDGFGDSVSLSNGLAVIGAADDDDGGQSSGSAYVFVRSGSVWSLQQKLTANDRAAADRFGAAVSVAGERVLIGAPGDDDGGTDSGSAYVFARVGVAWTQRQKLAASDRAAGDSFGTALALSGNAVIVGAPGDDGAGSAYAFLWNGSAWTQDRKLVATAPATGNLFGASVAASGATVLVGAPFGDGCATDSGEAYVFRLLCTTIPYGTGCGGATLSAVADFTTPGAFVLSLRDPGAIALPVIAFGDQRASLPFPPSCTVLNNLLFALPASIHPFDPNLATLRFRPPAIPGIVFQVQGLVGLGNGWLDLSNGVEFICP